MGKGEGECQEKVLPSGIQHPYRVLQGEWRCPGCNERYKLRHSVLIETNGGKLSALETRTLPPNFRHCAFDQLQRLPRSD
jgi:hypothetical protein